MHKEKPIILFKYGGNAMVNNQLKTEVLSNILKLKEKGYDIVIVHGGGPYIQEILNEVNIESEFIDGHRKTSREALEYVEMALKGKVNSHLVSLINTLGGKAVGLSGRDGKTVTAVKRVHKQIKNGKEQEIDLGRVGNVDKVDTTLIKILLDHDYIPVISCLAADSNGKGYNINGDMLAGHIAGALNAQQFVLLTNVDGLLTDINHPESIITDMKISEIAILKAQNIINGGMIPKIESCRIAIEKGAKTARIINGTHPEKIPAIVHDQQIGTLITK